MLKAVRSLRKARYNPPSFSLSLSVPLSLCEAIPPPPTLPPVSRTTALRPSMA